MRCLFLFLFCSSCLAQLPVVPLQTFKAPASGPLPTANTILWADFAAGSKFYNSSGSSTPSNGDKIAGYTDLTANHWHLTNTGSSTIMPVYTTSSGPSGGQPFLAFNGVTGNCLSNNFNNTTYSQPITHYYVINDFLGGVTMELMDGFVSDGREVYFFSSGGGGDRFQFAGSSVSIANALANFGGWSVMTFQFNGSSSILRTNGVVAKSGMACGSQGLHGYVLGNRYDGLTPLGNATGIAAIVINNAADSSTVMHSIESFLGSEYGITIH